jgi:zinc transport system substrate-binding protein
MTGLCRWPGVRLVAALTMALATAAACGVTTSGPARPPSIEVVTGLYPLAQAAAQVGGRAVSVTNVVPPGADPRAYRLSAAQETAVRQASVVILAGFGFQPSLDAAASGARRVLNLQTALSATDPYVWLDPRFMVRAVTAIAGALEAANPASSATYRAGARAFSDEVASTGIDYQSTLSVCPRRTIVTADGAFVQMAESYGLTDQVVGTGGLTGRTGVAAAAAAAQSAGVTTAFSEPFVAPGPIQAVAAAAHLKVRVLDPLTGPPPGGWARQADYIRLMEANLGTLNRALGCPDTSLGA